MSSRSKPGFAPGLIVNGDDFGYSPAVNKAIIEAHRRGILTSASLMVNELAAADAIALARATPTLAVGLHLSLVLGRAGLPRGQVRSITDGKGNFSRSPALAGLNYFFNPRARIELRREMRCQFERFAASGLRLSHVDGHNHLHMHPVVFKELITLCEEFKVKRVRVVRGGSRAHFETTGRKRPPELLISVVFDLLSRHCERRLQGRNFVVPPAVHGLLQTGGMTEEYFMKLLPRIGREGAEIYLHPLSAEATQAERNENPGGQAEFEALVSTRVRRQIEDCGFRLATYESV